MGERLRVDPNERVDLLDFSHGTNNIIIEEMARFWRAFALQNPASAPDAFRILTGLNVTEVAGPLIRVTFTGSRFFANEIRDGVDHFGFLAESETGNPAQQDLDLTAEADGDYDIYVRHFTQAGQAGNRVLWNADTGAEENATVNTRDLPRLQATYVANGAPNPYVNAGIKVADVNKAGAVYTIVQNQSYYFEGARDNTGAPYTNFAYEPRWGLDATDENTDRAANGITDLYTFVQYCRRQIGEIIGMGLAGATTNPLRPWDRVPAEVPSLADLRVEHYERGTADAGRHKDIIIRSAATLLTFDPTGGADDGSLSWLGGAGTGRFQLGRIGGLPLVYRSPTAPTAPSLLISGGMGAAANMGAAEEAHLLFGADDPGDGKDFRLIAAGAVADDDRELRFVAKTAAGVPEVEARVRGDGSLNVRGEFGYEATRTGYLLLPAAAWTVEDATALGVAAATDVKFDTGDGSTGSGPQFWTCNHAAGSRRFTCVVNLPEGSSVLLVRVHVNKQDANHAISARFSSFDVTTPGSTYTLRGGVENDAGVLDQVISIDAGSPTPLPGPPPYTIAKAASGRGFVIVVDITSGGGVAAPTNLFGAEVVYSFDDLRGD